VLPDGTYYILNKQSIIEVLLDIFNPFSIVTKVAKADLSGLHLK